MGTLLKYELKKILSQRAYWITLVLVLLILLTNELTPVVLGNYGPKIELEKSLDNTVIDDSYLSTLTKETNSNNPLVFFVKSAAGSTEVSGYTEDTLYPLRKEINEKLMREQNLSDKTINMWKHWDDQISSPYIYRYNAAYTSFFEIAGYMNFMILILFAVTFSGIFADEITANMDQMIFSAKEGKKKLFGIKILAGFIVCLFSLLVIMGFEWVLLFFMYGNAGADMILQILVPQCMLPMTIGEGVLAMMILFVLEGSLLCLITMGLSQITKSRTGSIGLLLLLMFLSMLNIIPEKAGLVYILWNTIPGTVVGSWFFTNYHTLFGLTDFIYVPILWLFLGIIMFFFAKGSYFNYEIKER